jgi:hypothetical protein
MRLILVCQEIDRDDTAKNMQLLSRKPGESGAHSGFLTEDVVRKLIQMTKALFIIKYA